MHRKQDVPPDPNYGTVVVALLHLQYVDLC